MWNSQHKYKSAEQPEEHQVMGRRIRLLRCSGGQSLLESALLLPIFITLVMNAVNLGYIFTVYLNLTSAPTQAVAYSTRGTSTVVQASVPSVDAVKALVYDNVSNTLPSASDTPTRICSLTLGLSGTGSNQVPNCTSYGTGSANFSALQPDPEAPYMVLHRVDIQYKVTPLIQGSLFNLLPDQITLHRMVTMRAMP